MRGSLIDVSERVAATNAVNQSLRDLQLLHQIASNAAHEPQEKIRQMLQLGASGLGSLWR